MKKATLILLLILLVQTAQGQTRRFSYAMTIGTGIALNEPSSTPFSWQVAGYYNIGSRFSAGIGTGVSCYEKTLIPLFGDVRFLMIRPRRFTPFLECSAGYAFAPGKDANGGLYFNPSIGVKYALRSGIKLLLSTGYEIQKMERLKSYNDNYVSSGFSEKLRHNSISLKAGILF